MARKTKAGSDQANPKGPVVIENAEVEAEAVVDAVEAKGEAKGEEKSEAKGDGVAKADARQTPPGDAAAAPPDDTPAEAAPPEMVAPGDVLPEDDVPLQDDAPQDDVLPQDDMPLQDDMPPQAAPDEPEKTDAARQDDTRDDRPEPEMSGPPAQDRPQDRPETTDTPEPVRPLVPALAAQVTVQKVGFVPLVLGGAIAAALGFGAAWFYFGQQDTVLSDLVAAQSGQIAALESQVAALPTEMPDLAPLEQQLMAAEQSLSADLTGLSDSVTSQIAAFDERLTAVERAPGVDGTLAATAIASWESELDSLRAEIAAQQARMGDIATSAEADLEATRAAAEQVEQDAAEAARQAVVRAALARIQVALDTGTPFEAALADLSEAGIEPPAALARAAADGVSTVGTLREAFPDAARAALSAARAEGVADVDTNPVTAFLRNQFDVRSVAPRQGDDPDAILSRVNAALNENRLTDALAEIEGLPEVARAEMQGWIARAQARIDAAAAVETLDQSMNN